MADQYQTTSTGKIGSDEAKAPVNSAQGRYEQLCSTRDPVLRRARECSMLTIPALLPPEGTNDASRLPQPFQSVGARGVNHLAAKLLIALFPPGSSFFKLDIDELVLDQLKKQALAAGATDPQTVIDEALSKVERAVLKRMESTNQRVVLNEYLKHTVVTGNGCLQSLKDGSLKFHAINNFVVCRDAAGNVIEAVVKEEMSRRALPPNALAIISSLSGEESDQYSKGDPDRIAVYTWGKREGDQWKTYQEICGKRIPGTDGQYPLDANAWLFGRWQAVAGASYGRGHCEEYLGDLYSLEQISKSIVEFAANAAKVLWLVEEGGSTQKSVIAKAPNSAVRSGNAKDVTILQMEKYADFQVVKLTYDDIKQRLEQAFLLNSSVQRNAERVTAEEIRFMAGELEQALGGTYSLFSGELQRPLVRRLMAVMQRQSKLPSFPKGVVTPTIVTGLDGLGRSSDMMKIDLWLKGTADLFGAPAIAEYTNIGDYMNRKAAALALEVKGMVRSEEDVQAARKAAAQQALLQKTAPVGVKAMSDQALAAQANQPE